MPATNEDILRRVGSLEQDFADHRVEDAKMFGEVKEKLAELPQELAKVKVSDASDEEKAKTKLWQQLTVLIAVLGSAVSAAVGHYLL